MKLKRYNSHEEILASYHKCTVSELKESTLGGEDIEGNECEYSIDDAIAGMDITGCWGYVDEQNTIHFWAKSDVDDKTLVHFFAHEIGHCSGTPCEDYMEEERRAETFGEVAAQAFEFAQAVKQGHDLAAA